ncbi:MAG TPA: cupin domain-containing protein [Planctomycetota bacterium]|nr:cupin domain-containing protein [Planctomycetota bacterium]
MVTSKATAEHYEWGAKCEGWRLLNRSDVSVIQECMPPGTQESRHYHAKARQFFFILKGTATMERDGESHSLGERQGIEIPPGIPHQIFNRSTIDLEFLVISSPTTIGDRVAT